VTQPPGDCRPERGDPAAGAIDEATLQSLGAGFVMSSLLHAAVDVQLFAALGETPIGGAELAAQLALSPRGLERLLDALVPVGLVARLDDDRWQATPVAARMLAPASPFARVLAHQHRHLYPLFFRLGAAVRSGAPQPLPWQDGAADNGAAADLYHSLAGKPDELALFLDAMNASSRGVGSAIAAQADVAAMARLIDLGGGGGQVAVELLQAVPSLRIDLVDFPAACQHALATARAAGVADRLRALPGDLLGRLPALRPAEAVLFSGVLGDFDADGRQKLLGRARELLRPDGRLLVSETLFDDDRRGPLMPALLALNMLLATPGGDNFNAAEWRAILADGGFGDVRVFSNHERGLRDLLIARRTR
jgi:SAM-dependent methyltransferase